MLSDVKMAAKCYNLCKINPRFLELMVSRRISDSSALREIQKDFSEIKISEYQLSLFSRGARKIDPDRFHFSLEQKNNIFYLLGLEV